MQIVNQLANNEEAFAEFYKRPVFMDSAVNTIMHLEKNLINKIITLT